MQNVFCPVNNMRNRDMNCANQFKMKQKTKQTKFGFSLVLQSAKTGILQMFRLHRRQMKLIN